MNNPLVLSVAVPGPFRKLFDYLPAKSSTPIPPPGSRVLVPFGKRRLVAILISAEHRKVEGKFKLKPVIDYLDDEPVFPSQLLTWLRKVAHYYHHPLGETLLTALPVALRKDAPVKTVTDIYWHCNNTVDDIAAQLKRAPKQLAVLEYICSHDAPVKQETLIEKFPGSHGILKTLQEKDLIQKIEQAVSSSAKIGAHTQQTKKLSTEQQSVVDSMLQHIDEFKVMLLDGVTGSGKTEVYITVARQVLEQGKQVLILLPEIALTPQLVSRFKNNFDYEIEVLHSGLNNSERYTVWDKVRKNKTKILIGTRSAIFSPFCELGLIVIDEEHDLSFKQQDGLRYSTRDIAILRANEQKIPIILGSATPSLESIANMSKAHYLHLHLKQRAGNAVPPKIMTLDIKGKQLTEGLASELIQAINNNLARNEQVLLFLNQRGFAPALICHECGSVEKCPRCERNMTMHQARQRITCHHCGYEKKIPQECHACGNTELKPLGFGTERIENGLKALFPETDIIRIDRDTTSRKNAILDLLQQVDEDKGQILLGTQMLAKGHDFPNVTLVGILNADQGLFGADLRSGERLAQLITQVAGRAGRGNKPGRVLIQTHHPEHDLWQTLINESYESYAQKALAERKQAMLPPFSYSALFRAESTRQNDAYTFLTELRDLIANYRSVGVDILGPVPAPMEKKAGKFRIQLLLMSSNREKLHTCIEQALITIETLKSAKKVRWNLDVDPLDMT